MSREPFRGEDGLAAFVLPLVLWGAVVVALVLVDLAGYLVAASRAQALADAAALAAVATDAPDPLAELAGRPAPRVAPETEARRVVAAGDGILEACTCPLGRGRAEVTVSVPVHGLVAPSVVAGRVEATATAALVPP
jgi:hypothetical protein